MTRSRWAVFPAAVRAAGVGLAAAAMAVLAPAAAARASPATRALASQCVARASRTVDSTSWAQSMLGAGSVSAVTQGSGQIVAVIGTGVSAATPALSGAVLGGRNVLTGGPADTDCLGEGTFAAGIIAARQVPGSAFAGVAPAVRILPVDVVTASGNVTSSAVAAGIRYAVASGALVVDAALSATPGPSRALLAAVRYASARNVVVIAPVAITSGFTTSANQVSYPAAYPGVIAVSAVGAGGSPASAGTPGVRVDLAAPGVQVVSTGPSGPGDIAASGAWTAAAFVAATAALVRSYHPQLTAQEVTQRLEVTADRTSTAVPDLQVGYGIVDPYAAVTAVLPEESGARRPAPDLPSPRLSPRHPGSTWPPTAALGVLGASAVLVIVVATGIWVIGHGRRRRWQPSAWPAPRPPVTKSDSPSEASTVRHA
jgi:membrane-anchored mycosin MYCP